MLGLGSLDPQTVVAYLVTLVVAITIHEFMHAWTAWKLGDDTAKMLGRITLNPAEHFDPIGALMFVFVILGAPVIAWGKPVPVNDFRLRPLGRFGRQGSMALVSLAGPLSNVVLGACAALTLRLANASNVPLGNLEQFLWIFSIVNFGLAAFNMIPLPPLDGSRILAALLPPFWRPILASLERYGIAILFLLIFFGRSFGGESPVSAIAGPVNNLLMRFFLGT